MVERMVLLTTWLKMCLKLSGFGLSLTLKGFFSFTLKSLPLLPMRVFLCTSLDPVPYSPKGAWMEKQEDSIHNGGSRELVEVLVDCAARTWAREKSGPMRKHQKPGSSQGTVGSALTF